MFSSSIPSTLTRLNDLLILNLSSNSLSGPLPIDIGKWKVLTSLDFSNNQFSSDIPTGVADLNDLTHFSLSNNRITGSVPESFGELLSLEFLDLSRNNLSGDIPQSLEKLRYLKYFNVSFNRLRGKIPEEGLFGNYSFESFDGNEALCGAARLHVPSCKTRHLKNSKARTKLTICVALPIAPTLLVVALIIIILRSRKRKDKLSTQEDLLPLGSWKRISYHELHQATDGFSQSKLLGNGSYGSVYHGTLSDGTTFAVKVFKSELEKTFKSFDVECEVLRNICHRNLIKIISSCSNDLDFKAIVLEFMPNGSLDKWLYSDNRFLDVLQRLNIMIDIASALEYLHHGNQTPIVHCDLKPNNILLDTDMVAHLSDFGSFNNDHVLINSYTEYGVDGIVSTKGDVYSFGILLMETFTRKKPTDEMFAEEISLKNWVKDSISTPLNQVVDIDLFCNIGRERSAVNNCALSVLQVGLGCSVELPDESSQNQMGNTFLSSSLLIIFHFSVATFCVKSVTMLTDQSALLALKDHVTNGPENFLTTNWSSSVPVCNWFGVTCGSRHDRVTALNLSGLGLVGTLPPHLGNLSFLSLLSIENNHFHGTLPVQLSNLKRIEHMNFGNNSFDGEIPSWLGSLTELRILFLYYNNFNGAIPQSLGYLSKLEFLWLYNNQVSGSIPSAIFNISSLQDIDLSNNMLSGSIPSISHRFPIDMFDHLPSLKTLDLSLNMLSGQIPASVSKCKELQSISLSYNQFEGSLPTEIVNLSSLQIFYIGQNQFKGEIPEQIMNLTRLREFDCSHNNFLGPIPFSIFNISSLQKINLRNNMLSGSIPSVSQDLLSLESIDFSSNNLTGGIANDMFDHIPKLNRLFLGFNMLSGRIPTSLFKCKELQVLSLAYNQLEGSLPVEIGNLSMLQFFFIGQNHFQGEIPRQIVNLTLLRQFDSPFNNFTGTIPPQIGNLKNLEILNLGVNNLVGSIPPQVFNISTLWKISVISNQLSGHLPSSIGLRLPNLEGLYVGGNHLVGPFPMSITNASKLTDLEMSSNYFSGSIPDTLGNLRNLTYLHLGFNNLTSLGMSFLSSLANCRGLEYLGFENNPLVSGELPGLIGNLSGSLQTFLASGCDIRGSIPNEIGNLSRLIRMELDDNVLTGLIPTTFGELKELQSVSLMENKFQGSVPYELCQLNNLAFLFLTSNNLSGPIPSCLGLNNLLILNLSSNSLSGPLPIDIGKWNVLTSMDLSNNQLSSDIPTGIANLKDLTHFSLSNNRITSFIPKSFGDLLSLEFLDLSRNNLSGEIPKSLEKLPYLKYFNVSFNRLQGEIPEGGPFGNYSFESFEGNEALCGATRLHVPSCKTKHLRSSKARTKLTMYVALPIASTILVVALIIMILRRRKRKDKLLTQEDLLPIGTWRRISYHELHQATDGFSDSRLLGNGSYGSVYQGALSDGMIFAVKVFKLEGAFKSFDVECEVLRNTRHRNLIKIISSCSNDVDFKALVLEFMPNGSLDKWLYSNNHFLDISQRLNIIIDVASALEYLHHGHSTPVVHCDLKPSNVLLDDDMVARLSDFGIAKLLCEEDSMTQTMTIATFGYMAPEYGNGGIVSTRGDVYSFGILIMETITRKKPTDEMFGEETSLKSWVEKSLSSSPDQVVDPNLLSTSERERIAANDCALSILQVGLECSAELPDERLNMKEIVTRLKKIRAKFLTDQPLA
ncbi:hypothetical protein GQ457_01G003600 [Hibiscus cannabinus]